MESFANEGGMLPEQVWDDEDLPPARMYRGFPTGSAMPLCWAHAEYLTLVRSRKDGVGFDLIPAVHERYVCQKATSPVEVWTVAHQPHRIRQGRNLRILLAGPATVRWSVDRWQTAGEKAAQETALGCWAADLPLSQMAAGTGVQFTFRWPDRAEAQEFSAEIA